MSGPPLTQITRMNNEQLKSAYRRMCLIRAFETRLDELFLQGVILGTTHLCIGQEACAVGACWALEPEDCVFSNHRGHGHLLARGAEPGRALAEIFGSPRGYSGGRGGSQHMAVKEINFMGTHGITAGTIPLAVGAALHKKRQQQAGVAAVFFGDGAAGQGVFHESLNMAQIWELPVLFICENNLYAMSTAHVDISPVPDVADRVGAYNMQRVIVDGNDVAAVYREVKNCRDAIMARPAPWFIELKTFRVSGHSRGDDCFYRSRAEEKAWQAKDPIARAGQQLIAAGAWTEAEDQAMRQEIAGEMAAAEAFAREEETNLRHA